MSDLNPELEQFTMDTRRAPKRIFDPPDQNAQLPLDLRSPAQWARLPTRLTLELDARPFEGSSSFFEMTEVCLPRFPRLGLICSFLS